VRIWYLVAVLGRLLIVALVVLFLVGLVSATWNLCDWPPPRLILKYGFPPTGGPTGRTMTIEGVEFAELKPGYFRMGSHFFCWKGDLLGRVCAVLHLPWGKQPTHYRDMCGCPPRWVEIESRFWIARTEVTNGQYERFATEHSRHEWTPAESHPVAPLSWDEARRYCEWLSGRRRLTVRLPNEAEWEYACRAGSTTAWCFGDDEAGISEYAWSGAALEEGAREVGTRRPNRWGLHDMYGNVWEWCEDTYRWDFEDAIVDAPLGRVIRGGSWYTSGTLGHSATRLGLRSGASACVGFRPAASGP
jgi:formylglycine-generating enzyme required for sulfatase activity